MRKTLPTLFLAALLLALPAWGQNTPPGLPGNMVDNGGNGKFGAVQLAPNSLLGAVTSNLPIPILPRNNLTLTITGGNTYLDSTSTGALSAGTTGDIQLSNGSAGFTNYSMSSNSGGNPPSPFYNY